MTERSDSNRPWLPVTREAVDRELRLTLMSYASGLAASLGDEALANEYVGFVVEDWDNPDLSPDTLKQIDLDRFYLAKWVLFSFNFAFQVGEPRPRCHYWDDNWEQGTPFLNSAPLNSWDGEPSPLADSKSAISLVLDTAYARLRLRLSDPLSVEHLSRLAFIKEAEVRSSLKAEGFTLSASNDLPADLAEAWLSRQPLFTPTLAVGEVQDWGEGFVRMAVESLQASKFHDAFYTARFTRDLTGSRLAAAAQVDLGWLKDLIAGRPVAADTDALARIAGCLRIDAPLFVSRGVEAILRTGGITSPIGKVTFH